MTEKTQNQYQTRPVTTSVNPSLDGTRVSVSVTDDLEEVAWRFHPDRERWEHAGLDREEARSWITVGVTNPTQAAAWMDANFDEGNARMWIDAGFGPREAEDWSEWFAPPDAAAWRSAGWWPETSHELVSEGHTVETAAAAYGSLPQRNDWVAYGFNATDAHAAHRLGWTPVSALQARRSGLDPTEDAAPSPLI